MLETMPYAEDKAHVGMPALLLQLMQKPTCRMV